MEDTPIRLACLGGGQLGRMMALEAPRIINVSMCFLESAEGCPAGQVCPHLTVGSIQDSETIQRFISQSKADIVTVEIEHVNCDVLIALEEAGEVKVRPSGHVIRLIQDKYLQKCAFEKAGIDLPPYACCPTRSAILAAGESLGWPLMLKARKGAYDGRGNAKVQSPERIEEALKQLGVPEETVELDLYAEGWIDFDCELAVMVVRSAKPDMYPTRSYPAVNAIQQNSICRIVLAPARGLSSEARSKAESLAIKAIDSLPSGASGVFGVEMFLTKEGKVLLNEVAPRPHNTGHYTQDACFCSQFENHLRAVCGLPLGSTKMKVPAAAMVNILGQDTMDTTLKSSNLAATEMTQASIHWYGKSCRKGRKMGHINLTADSESEINADVQRLLELEGVPLDALPNVQTPLVGVIMGSQSDLPTMQAAVEILKRFRIPYEVDIVSAHRTPEKLLHYSRNAAGRGIRVIIAGAGGAAHLPGMVASLTPLPVIGVPVKTSTLSGVDSLYSIVQMPRGIPVATVAIGNAQNAGLLAVRILGSSSEVLLNRMQEYQTELKEMVEETSERLLAQGSDEYLSRMDGKNKSVNV